MPNTSATGGYLAPLVTSPPTEDADLDAQLQALVVGITGLDGSFVRPRWQPTDPKQPDRSINWCAIGVTSIAPDVFAYVHHVSPAFLASGNPLSPPQNNDPAAYDEMQRHQVLSILASFYGPASGFYADLLTDGFTQAQNLEATFLAGMGFVDVGTIVPTGELVNQGFIRRRDVPFRVRRINVRRYPVLNIASSPGAAAGDDGRVNPFNAEATE